LSARLLAGSSLDVGVHEPLAGCTIMNVPGPTTPLYFDGARMTYFSAIMPISDGMGLVFAVTSYDGMIFISPTSCREQLPDPEFFAQCIRDSFQEYLAVADRKPKGRAKRRIKKVVVKRKAATRKKAA
jgi:diacylglycerol O-acyltransferase